MAYSEDDTFTRRKPVSPGQTMGAADLHDAWPLVVFENKWPFHAPRRHHNALCPDLHVALIKGVCLCAYTEGGDVVVVIETYHWRMGKYPHVRMFFDPIGEFPPSFI